MPVIIIVYTLLIIIFLVISSLILRHTFKFSYLSPKFTIVVGIFGVLALGIIILSVWLLLTFNRAGSVNTDFIDLPNNSSNNGLNF